MSNPPRTLHLPLHQYVANTASPPPIGPTGLREYAARDAAKLRRWMEREEAVVELRRVAFEEARGR